MFQRIPLSIAIFNEIQIEYKIQWILVIINLMENHLPAQGLQDNAMDDREWRDLRWNAAARRRIGAEPRLDKKAGAFAAMRLMSCSE